MSKPFERFGMHWLVMVEKELPAHAGNNNNNNNAFNLMVRLFCLSVSIGDDHNYRREFPLKGIIRIDQMAQDGQPRFFHAQTGEVCNLVGKNFPADAVQMEGFTFSLCSGKTKTESVEISMVSEDEGLGGYYGEGWRGAGGILLENHVFDPIRDGAAIQVTLRFCGKPRPLCYVD